MEKTNSNKVFVVDSSVFLHDPNAIFAFEQNIVVVPGQVFSDLDAATKLPGERGANARQALHTLWNIISGGRHDFRATDEDMQSTTILAKAGLDADTINSFSQGAKTVCAHIKQTGGILAFYEPTIAFPNEAIFATVQALNAILVTKNTAQRLAACSKRLKAEDYRHDRIMDDDRFYTGRSIIYLPSASISKLSTEKTIPFPDGTNIYYTDYETDRRNPTEKQRSSGYRLSENEFLVIRNIENPTSTFLARYANKKLHALIYANEACAPFDVKPRNAGQIFAIEALMAPCDVAPLVILKGQAGTAKTFLSLACGLQQAYNESIYNRVIVSRPGNSVIDSTVGFLPGDERAKVEPLNRAIFDNIEALMPGRKRGGSKDDTMYSSPAEDLLDRGVLQLQAMTYMRGRSIQSSFIIIDEAQNATQEQLRALTTRPNVGTKIVLTGDVEQIDDPYLDKFTSGLTFVSERMRGSPLCWQISFNDDECERSPLVQDVLRRLGRD